MLIYGNGFTAKFAVWFLKKIVQTPKTLSTFGSRPTDPALPPNVSSM